MKDILYKFYALLFSNRTMLYFNKLLFQLSLRGMGILNHYNYRLSGEKHFLNKILPKYTPTVIFDVGANVGNYTLAAIKKNPVQVFCFEPMESNYKRLLENISGLKNIRTVQIGMSDVLGSAEIYDHNSSQSTSQATLYSDVISDLYKKETKKSVINLSTIDSYCSENKIDKISLVKIDTEGNEYKILLGSQMMLNSNKIDIIHFEFNTMNVSSRVFFKDFFKLLSNYNLYRMLPHSLLPLNYLNPVEFELFAFQNIIAIRKDIDKS